MWTLNLSIGAHHIRVAGAMLQICSSCERYFVRVTWRLSRRPHLLCVHKTTRDYSQHPGQWLRHRYSSIPCIISVTLPDATIDMMQRLTSCTSWKYMYMYGMNSAFSNTHIVCVVCMCGNADASTCTCNLKCKTFELQRHQY